VESTHGTITLNAVDLAPESYAGIGLVSGRPERAWPAFHRGAILIAEPFAWRWQLREGDRLTLNTPQGARAFDIAAVYREYGVDRGGVIMEGSVYRRLFADDAIGSLGLYLAPGVAPDEIIPRLYAAATRRQSLLIGSNADVRNLSMSIFERTFVITRVLNWLAATVAAIALLSALLAWELEHSHELAVLRSLGLTPRGAATVIHLQTGFMGLVALLAALPAGLLTAVLLVEVINRRAFGWQLDFHLRGSQLIDALLLSLVAALAAGLYPAWRSARMAIASELREE
jgi:putative ABC transport system permease protein